MTERENYLQTIRFGNPKWIPADFYCNFASLIRYKEEMEKVMSSFPEFFKDFVPGQIDYSQYGDGSCDIQEQDAWGYTWHYSVIGLEGCVLEHPLSDWKAFENYRAPDPLLVHDRGGKRDWEKEFQEIKRAKANGELVRKGLVHGFLFLRLQYLRGFENLMVDMFDQEPRLLELIDMIVEHNLKIVNNYCRAGVDVLEIPEDLGAENSMIISRDMFRKYIMPAYRKLIEPCKQNGVLVDIHSDGYILDIIEDLVELGIDIINPQDLCNGIDNLARVLKGKACIRLDLDRVRITPTGTRKEIFELIEEEVKTLGSKNGGLAFIYGIYPPTPPENVYYVCEAMKKYHTYWFDK